MTKARLAECRGSVAKAPGGNSPADTGWPLDRQELGDFYHRIRAFPPDVARWRKAFVDFVLDSKSLFPLVPADSTPADIRPQVDLGISFIREISTILAVLYASPGKRKSQNPVDDLVRVILSKAGKRQQAEAFERVKAAFPRWDRLLEAPRSKVSRLVGITDRAKKATRGLFAALEQLQTTFGSCSMRRTAKWSDTELEEFLCTLPFVSKSDTSSVMLSMGRSVFPVSADLERVLVRLGPYREIGLDLERVEARKRRVLLSEMIPPNLRPALHRSLLEHAREVCRSRPVCEKCELRSFCSYYRKRRVEAVAQDGGPTVIDLFSGAGGLSDGFRRSGFRTLLAIDKDPSALRTFRLNHPEVPEDHVLEADIRDVTAAQIRRLIGRRTLDLLAGSPPCQGFSLTGSRSKPGQASQFHSTARRRTTKKGDRKKNYHVAGDHRNYLYEFMVDLALELRPRLFLLENVPGMSSAKRSEVSFLEEARQALEERGGYRAQLWKLNAAAFGVPQDRVRLFLVASRLRMIPARPEQEYRDQLTGSLDLDALDPVTFQEATFDLPPREAASGRIVDAREPSAFEGDRRLRRYLKKFDVWRSSRLLFQHRVRYHNDRDLELYNLLRPGEDSVHAVERHGRRDLMRYRQDAFDDKYARLRPDRPSKTIVAHLAKDGNGYIHPEQVRSITLREAARLQSFHDDYVFCGAPSEQWVQIGNAVPPVLAEAIARSFLTVLKK